MPRRPEPWSCHPPERLELTETQTELAASVPVVAGGVVVVGGLVVGGVVGGLVVVGLVVGGFVVGGVVVGGVLPPP